VAQQNIFLLFINYTDFQSTSSFFPPPPRPAAGRVDRQQPPGPQAAAIHARHSTPEAQTQPHPATQGREGGKTRVRRCVRHTFGPVLYDH